MKKQRKNKQSRRLVKKQPIFTLSGAANDFIRGAVSYIAVAALTRRDALAGEEMAALPVFDATVLKRATLTGAALVAGVAAGKAVERGNYLTATLTAVGGITGVYALDRLLEQAISQQEA